MDKELRVLILEDVATDAELMERELRKAGIAFSSRRVETKEVFLKELKGFAPDIVLADYSLPQFDGLSALAIIQEQCPDVPFILVSGAIGEELAIEAIKSGATDYVLKQRLSRLGHSVRRALREVEERTVRKQTEEALKQSDEQLRTVFEASLDAIIAVNEQGNIVLFNPAAEELFLYSPEDVLNKPIKILFRKNAAEAHQNRLERFLSIGIGQCGHIGRRLERIFRRKDGTTFEAEVAMAGGRRDGNRLIVVSIHDVTERKKAEKALQESQAQYRDLVETIEDWIWEVDANGVYTYVSPRAHDILGYEPEELIGKTPFDIMTPEESKRVGNIFSGLVAAKKPILSLENTNIHKDGQLVVLETSGKPFFDADGTLLGYRGVDRNITEHKQAKESLERLRRQNELILNSAGEGIFGLDLQGKHTFVNPAGARMLGYKVEELIGQSSHEIWHCSKADGSPYPEEECPVYAAYRDGAIHHGDNEVFWRKDGTGLPVEYSSTPIREGGELIGAVVTFRDITQRKGAEEKLRESEEKLSVMLQSISDHMSMIDKDLNIIWANETARKIFGNDIIGKKCYEVYHSRKEPCEPYPCLTLKAFQDGKVHEHDTQVTDKNGNIIYFHCTANVALKDNEGKPATVIEISRDITEHKRADEALRKSEEELKKRVKELEEFYNMAVGRELKMVELKEEIERLKEEFKKYKGL